MRILYLTWDNVWQPMCGCAQRSSFLYEALRKISDVDVVQLKHEWVRESFVAKIFRKLAKVARWPYGKSSIDLSALPLQLSTTTKRYDVVVCRYLMTAAITQAWRIAPCYVDIDDMPTEAFASVDSKRLPPFLRPLGALLVAWWQKVCLKKCAGFWTIDSLPNLARRPSANYDVNHPQENLLMTVGLMGYVPNQEGVDWFLANIWPKVHERWPDMAYAIAGGGLPESLKAKWASIPGVRVLGFVDDLDALYAKSLAVVTPILSGAGTCIKVVEAGLHGRFVLATIMAVRGHDALMSLGGIKVFEAADQFCASLESILSLPDRLAAQGRLSVATNHINSIEAFESSVREILS